MSFLMRITSLSRPIKLTVSISIDFLGLILCSVAAIWLRLGTVTSAINHYYLAIALLPLLALPLFLHQGIYRSIVRYIGYKYIRSAFVSVTLLICIWTVIIFMSKLDYPRSALVITWLLAMFYIAGSRFFVQWILTHGEDPLHKKVKRNVIIFGAGSAGQQLLRAVSKVEDIKVIAFIEDDKSLINHEIESIRVYGRDSLIKLVENKNVDEVYLAIPSLPKFQRKLILEWLEPYPLKVSILPGMDKIFEGKVKFSDIREVNVIDLLGRETVSPKVKLLEKCIENKAVMVTGAGGSIGTEICRQVIKCKPKVLVLFELSELALYQIESELKKELKDAQIKIVSLLGNVQNEEKIRKIIRLYQVNTIYHAAAYKHVPIVEHNIAEGIYNNTCGTLATALAAAKEGVDDFVLVSTDKAVRPTNVMGASKRMAEMVLQALQEEYKYTRFIMVRFGNVLGSSGSVIPLFNKQIAAGGPVTVTHKEITRYFMTIAEASSLVIQAGSMGTGGEVFVLDMGEPIKIDLLARKLIKLSGLEVIDESGKGDIGIQYTGLRPGEKLYEELLIGDNVDGTEHPRILKASEAFFPYSELIKDIEVIKKALSADNYELVKKTISKLVTGYQSKENSVDYFAKENKGKNRLKNVHKINQDM